MKINEFEAIREIVDKDSFDTIKDLEAKLDKKSRERDMLKGYLCKMCIRYEATCDDICEMDETRCYLMNDMKNGTWKNKRID